MSEMDEPATKDQNVALVAADKRTISAISAHQRRKVMPLGGDTWIPPGAPASVSGCPLWGAFSVEQILISDPANHWVVNDILIAGRSQIEQKNLPGALFSSRGIAKGPGATSFTFSGLDVVEFDKDLTLVVTYVGPNPEGARLFATAVGKTAPVARPSLRVASVPIRGSATIVVRPDADFLVQALRIMHDPASWLMSDIRIHGKSQFALAEVMLRAYAPAQAGAVPGGMFADNAANADLTMDLCRAGDAIELDVVYIGEDAVGQCFQACLEGRVSNDPANTPELRAQIETVLKGQSHDMEIL